MPEKNSDRVSPATKILLVVSSYQPHIGGLQTMTSRLAVELQRRGYQVQVITQRHPRHLPAIEQIDGIAVTRLMFLYPSWQQLKAGRFDLLFAGLWYFPATTLRLLKIIRREKPDIVNLHFVGEPTVFVLIAQRLSSFRLVVSLHGDDVKGLPHRSRFVRWLFRSILRTADRVTACSNYLLEQASAIEPTISDKSQVVYNGVELPTEIPDSVTRESVLAVGRLIPKKGFDVLLRALALLTSPRVTVKLIGAGPELEALQSLAHALHLEAQIEFAGAQDQRDVQRAMQICKLVVVPSRQEPFGVVALEAMVAGKPIVATRVGGLPEVLRDADAFLIEPDNPHALAQAIQAGLQRVEHDPTFGQRNRLLAEQFSIERMVAGYLENYQLQIKSR